MKNPFLNTRYQDASLSKVTDFTDEQALQVSEWLKKPKNFLYFHSHPGLGKTYIAAAITNQRFSEGKYCYYFSEDRIFTLLDEFEANYSSASHKMEMICENEFIIWDDMCATLANTKNNFSDAQKKKFIFQFIDSRYTWMLPTIIISNHSPEQIGELVNNRLESRLSAKENLIIELLGEDKRQDGL